MKRHRITGWMVLLCLLLIVAALAGGGIVYATSRGAQSAQEASEEGIVIAAVDAEGPAAAAGVVRGDILLQINDEALENAVDLLRYLKDLEPGDAVELTVLHGDDVRAFTTTLGERLGQPYLGVQACGGLGGMDVLSVLPERLQAVVAEGAAIVEVVPDSPADEAGLQEGDRIVAVDGQELDADNDLAALIAAHAPGDTVTLQIEGPDADSREVTVQLAEHPDDEGVAYLGVRYAPLPHFEMHAGEEMPFRKFFGGRFFDRDSFDFEWPDGDFEHGAILLSLADDCPAAEAGLNKGDVITAVDGEPLTSPQSLSEAIAARAPGERVTLTVRRPGEEEAREIQVTLAEHPDREGAGYLGVSVGGYYRGFFRGGPFEGQVPPEGLGPFQRFFEGLPFFQEGQEGSRGFRFRVEPGQFFDFQGDGSFEFDWDGDFEFQFPPGLFEDEPCCSGDNTL